MSKKKNIQIKTKKKKTNPPDQYAAEFCEHEWLKLHPKGIVFEGSHFMFLLEEEHKNLVLPLRYPLQSADLLGVVNMQSLWKRSLNFVLQDVLKNWGAHFRRCAFVRMQGNQHMVRLSYMREDGQEGSFEASSEQVLGLCLEAQLPFYATREYITQSQVVDTVDENFLQQKQKWTDGRQKYLM